MNMRLPFFKSLFFYFSKKVRKLPVLKKSLDEHAARVDEAKWNLSRETKSEKLKPLQEEEGRDSMSWCVPCASEQTGRQRSELGYVDKKRSCSVYNATMLRSQDSSRHVKTRHDETGDRYNTILHDYSTIQSKEEEEANKTAHAIYRMFICLFVFCLCLRVFAMPMPNANAQYQPCRICILLFHPLPSWTGHRSV